MKIKSSTIISLFTILIVVGVVFVPEIAHAQVVSTIARAGFNNMLGWLVNTILVFVSGLVTAGGVFLSISMNITLHIKDLFDKIPAIQDAWVTIRNISSILIIFALLYASILTILNVEKAGLKKLVGAVFMAGLLINFSLFFVKVAVDASNLVSMQFYNAIAPQTATNFTTKSAYFDGGISNIFMQSLGIPKLYADTGFLKSADVTVGITLAGIGGILIMVTAAISFFAAAIAFMIRTGVLIFIMALSPLFFVGMIFPQVKKEASDKLLDLLKGQLIFMPVYLFLMYVALKFISDPGFMGIFNTTGATSTSSAPTSVGIIIQFTIAMLFINAPLVVAIKLGGMGMKWAPDAKGVSKMFAGFTGQHTFGRGAKAIVDSERFKNFAAKNPNLATLAGKGLGKVSGATFLGTKGGYDKRFKDYSKARSDLAKKLGPREEDVQAHLTEFDSTLAYEKDKLKRAQAVYTNNLNTGGSDKAIADAKKIIDATQARIKEMEEKRGGIEKEFRQSRTKEFAENLTGSFNPITKKARKEAAEAIRKELNKGKKDKAVDAIKEFLEDSEKTSEKKDEGDKKEEGGDKK